MERGGGGFCSTLVQSLAAEGTQSSHIPTGLGTFSEAAPRTGPVLFVAVEELLVGASFAGGPLPAHPPAEALPPCPVVDLSPLQVSWYQATCPPCEIHAPPPT